MAIGDGANDLAMIGLAGIGIAGIMPSLWWLIRLPWLSDTMAWMLTGLSRSYSRVSLNYAVAQRFRCCFGADWKIKPHSRIRRCQVPLGG